MITASRSTEKVPRNTRQLYLNLFLFLSIVFLCPGVGWTQSAASNGYGAAVDLELNLLNIGADVGVFAPAPDVSGEGDSSYGPLTGTAVGVDIGLLNAVSVDTGLLSGAAAYDQPGLSATGEGAVENAEVLAVLPGLLGLGVTADSIFSNSEITGTCGNLQVNASSTIINGLVNVGASSVSLAANAAPNTSVNVAALGLAGVSIILNEQIISGDGDNSLSVVTNALHIHFNIDLLLVDLSGDIILGSSGAAISNCDQGPADSADVSVLKTASPDPVTVGEVLTYTIQVSNAGPDAASNVSVTDQLPAGVVIQSINADGGFTCGADQQTVACVAASLAAASTANIVIDVIPVSAGVLINTAVAGQDTADPDGDNNTSTVTTTVDPEPQASADVSVLKTASAGSVTVGELLTYTIQVSNAGPDAATNVSVTDMVPTGAAIQSVAAGGGFTCVVNQQSVVCDSASLAAASSADINIGVIPSVAGVLTNTAVVSHGANDPDDGNNTSTVTTTVDPLPPASADISVLKTASSDSVSVGEVLSYTIQVSNAGPDTAENFVISDAVPAAMLIQSINPSAGLSCSQNGQQVNCSGASLAAGASASVLISTLANVEGVAVNTAIVSQQTNDPDSDNNQSTVSTTVTPPAQPQANLSVAFSPPLPASVISGELMDVFVVVTNDGPDIAEQVFLQIDTPLTGNVEQVLPDNGLTCTFDEFNVDCQLPQLAVNAQTVVQVIVELDIPGPDQPFAAMVDALTNDPDTSDNQVSALVDVQPRPGPALDINKHAVPEVAYPGEPLVFVITIENLGDEFAENILMEDVMDEQLLIRQSSADNGGECGHSGQAVRCEWPALAAGDIATATLVTQVAEDAVPGTLINNDVSVIATDCDGDCDSDSVSVPVEPLASAQVLNQCRVNQISNNSAIGDQPFGLIDTGGKTLIVGSRDNVLGLNPDAELTLGEYDLLSKRYRELIAAGDDAQLHDFSKDRQLIALSSSTDPQSGIATADEEVYLYDRYQQAFVTDNAMETVADSADILTAGIGDAAERMILLTSGADQNQYSIVALDKDGAVAETLFTAAAGSQLDQMQISGRAGYVVFRHNGDPLAQNADSGMELFMLDTANGALRQLTDTNSQQLSIGSLDSTGGRIAFTSDADLTGDNPDGNVEVFVFDTASGFRQITRTLGVAENATPLLTHNGNAVLFVSAANLDAAATNAEPARQIFRAELAPASLRIVQLSRFTDPLGSRRITSSNASGSVIAFSSSGDLINGRNSDGSEEVFVMDCFEPRNGNWYNPLRNGNGIELELTQNNRMGIIWYTFAEDGRPVWYLAVNTFTGRSWEAELTRSTLINGTTVRETVGTVYLAFDDSHNAVLAWTLNGEAGAEPFEFLEFDRAPPLVDLTASWYPPEQSGWGSSIVTQGDRAGATVFFFDNAGQPVWALVQQNGDTVDTLRNVRFSTSTELCPGCEDRPSPPLTRQAGTIELDFLSQTEAVISTNILDADSNIEWLRSMVDYVVLTRRAP